MIIAESECKVYGTHVFFSLDIHVVSFLTSLKMRPMSFVLLIRQFYLNTSYKILMVGQVVWDCYSIID